MRKWKEWKPVVFYRNHLDKILISEQGISRDQRIVDADRFVVSQFFLLLAAGAVLLFLLGAAIFLSLSGPKPVTLDRQPFGQGDREVSLILDQERKKKEYSFVLGEQEISREEEEQLFEDLFNRLEKTMAGENPSLEEVTKPLNFPGTLSGYPFVLTYQPVDADLIEVDGSLGKKASGSKSARYRTEVRVTAGYGEKKEEHSYSIVVISGSSGKKTDFDLAVEELSRQEQESRSHPQFTLPAAIRNVRIRTADPDPAFTVPAALLLLLLACPVCRHFSLKDRIRRRQEETEKDFSLHVHLLSLFMGAGLSFPSAVARISQAYQAGKIVPERRISFDRVVMMNKDIHDGLGIREALGKWAGSFSFSGYRKLALILTQCLSKGQADTVAMMEKEEQKAFTDRIDRARSQGEEARTRLLFPMIVLLAATMMLIMFPALVTFYRY